MIFNIHRSLNLVNYYISYLAQQSDLTSSYKAPAFVSLPLHSSITLELFTPQIFTIKKAFSYFIAHISFSYLYLLIRGSIKLRLIIYLVFILLICCDVNDETARSCVLLAVCGYYVYMVRNVKFNLLSWLYTLTLLSLSLSIILTFWYLLSLFIPYIIILCNLDFPHGYDLSINPTDPDNSGGNYPGKAGGPVGVGGGASGSGGAGGSGGDPNSQNTLMEKAKSPPEDKDQNELEKVEDRIVEIKGKLDSLYENCWEKQDYAQIAASEYSQARKDYLDVSESTIVQADQEGFEDRSDSEDENMYSTDEYQEAEEKMRAAELEHVKAQEELEQAEDALRRTSNIRIELAEAEGKRSSLLQQSKKK